MLLESSISLLVFIVISIFMSNFIIGISKTIILNNKISSDTLKMRELEIFLTSEFDEYAFDFKVLSDEKIYYKKIVPVNSKKCEIKERELSFKNGNISLRYDNRNRTVLLNKVDKFDVYKRGNLIFVYVKLDNSDLTKIISVTSYNI